MNTIGIVCEGPRDFDMLSAIIDTILNEEQRYLPLQPEPSADGIYGNGWKGVWKWCEQHGSFINQYMTGVTPRVDLLIVHMDGDVSRKEKESHCECSTTECQQRADISPLRCEVIKRGECPVTLPCPAHVIGPAGYVDHLHGLLINFFQETDSPIIVTIPCDSTDAWIVSAYENLANYENIEDPWRNVIAYRQKYQGISVSKDKKPSFASYRVFVQEVCNNWEMIKQKCDQARDFENNILLALGE